MISSYEVRTCPGRQLGTSRYLPHHHVLRTCVEPWSRCLGAFSTDGKRVCRLEMASMAFEEFVSHGLFQGTVVSCRQSSATAALDTFFASEMCLQNEGKARDTIRNVFLWSSRHPRQPLLTDDRCCLLAQYLIIRNQQHVDTISRNRRHLEKQTLASLAGTTNAATCIWTLLIANQPRSSPWEPCQHMHSRQGQGYPPGAAVGAMNSMHTNA